MFLIGNIDLEINSWVDTTALKRATEQFDKESLNVIQKYSQTRYSYFQNNLVIPYPKEFAVLVAVVTSKAQSIALRDTR